MEERDTFGADPQVRYLRRVFAGVEKLQADFLGRLNVSPFDYRLRRIRETTLKLFEDAGMAAGRRGIVQSEEETAILYIYCLARALTANRIPVADGDLPAHGAIAKFMKEAHP
jgi:hypothetical protein